MEIVKEFGGWIAAIVAALIAIIPNWKKNKTDETAQALTAWKEMREEMQQDRDESRKRERELQIEVDNLRQQVRDLEREIDSMKRGGK